MFLSCRPRISVALALLACFLLPASKAVAQTLGAKTGVQWTQLKSDGGAYPGAERRPGFFGGLYWELGRGPIMAQIEGLAGRMTVRRNGYDTDIASVEVPVLARVNFIRAPNSNVFVTAGGAVASRWRARNVVNGTKIDITDEIEPLDVQWIVSGGFEVRRLLVDVRYTRGLRNIDATTDGEPKVTTERFGVSVGYRF